MEHSHKPFYIWGLFTSVFLVAIEPLNETLFISLSFESKSTSARDRAEGRPPWRTEAPAVHVPELLRSAAETSRRVAAEHVPRLKQDGTREHK